MRTRHSAGGGTLAAGRRILPAVMCVMAIAGARAEEAAAPSSSVTTGHTYQSPLDKRIEIEQMSQDNPFVLTSHKPTYLLPISYNSRPNGAAVGGDGGDLDSIEMKFQISLKFSVWRHIFGDNGHLSLAYTQQAYWQAYNREISSPFRETSHEPEAMLSFTTDFDVLGMRNRMLVFGFVHQSNGQTEESSRSWNRLYANFILERRNLVISFRPWYRLPEDVEDDDNPDIEDYLGHGDLTLAYESERHVYSLLFRNNLKTGGDNHGAIQLDWSFPLKDRIKGYVQIFNGYGESLIDYDRSVTRLGLGIMLNDWL
ncbi:MAG: phospholipase A [Gammaproteobacteria bacterium]|nr:phospholipase A [Gammaproteobacteria bacterium]